MTKFEQYEYNEYQVAKSLTDLFKAKDIRIYPTTPDSKNKSYDLRFSHKKKNYVAEIKCRKNQQFDYLIEKQKLKTLIGLAITENSECRYINYIEDVDALLIFDINSRENLELSELFIDPIDSSLYESIYAPRYSVDGRKEYIKKYVKYLYLNPYQTKDYIIKNYSQHCEENGVEFNYKKVQ